MTSQSTVTYDDEITLDDITFEDDLFLDAPETDDSEDNLNIQFDDPQTDGEQWGRSIGRALRRHGKRTVAGLGTKYFRAAARCAGRGQVFYLAAAYGILKAR